MRIDRADFVFNNGAEVSTLDPAATSGVPEGRVMYALFEGLTVKHPETLEPLPGVAESWTVSADGRTYTFHLRRDARWSNGEAVTAHDFEGSWKRLLSPATAAEYAYQLWYLENARDYTLLRDDRLYAVGGQLWVQKRKNGRARIGLAGFDLPGGSIRLVARVGEEAGGAALARSLERSGPWVGPLAGRITEINEELPESLGEIEEDPFDKHWLVEIELSSAGLDRALASGKLLTAERARDEIFWPRVGARAVDRFTFEVQLAAPTPFFLHLTSFYATFPVHLKTIEKARDEHPNTWQIEWLRPRNLVTNGPFLLRERRLHDRIRLAKNPSYWDGDHVAFNTIDILSVESYATMLNLYLTGEVDWIERCAPNLVPRMLAREDYRPVPYLGSYFFRVNVHKPPFDDKRVRRALALAIDRRAIVEKITKKGELVSWSVCPPGLEGYEPAEMKHAPVAADLSNFDEAYAEDCAEAVALLLDAGYGPGRRRLPTIEVHYNTSESHRDIAEVLADTWKRVLGLDAKLLNQEWKVYLDTQRTFGYDVSRSAWIQDYPDPNTFIDIFVTGGENNRTGWSHARFDELVRQASSEADEALRMQLLREAETIVLEELPILPVYSYTTNNAVNPRLGGFFENSQDDHSPKFWYWMDDEELAAKRRRQAGDRQRVPAPGPRDGLYPPAGRQAVYR